MEIKVSLQRNQWNQWSGMAHHCGVCVCSGWGIKMLQWLHREAGIITHRLPGSSSYNAWTFTPVR